jgi:hypothetical protein
MNNSFLDLALPRVPLGTWFYVAAAIWVGLMIEMISKPRTALSLMLVAIYGMVAIWYGWDLMETPETYAAMDPDELDLAFLQVALFLASVRIGLRPVVRQMGEIPESLSDLSIDSYLKVLLPIWLVFFGFGVFRMEGDISAALWPVLGRDGPHMWGRGAIGGGLDAFVSLSGYVYMFICALFGILLALARSPAVKMICVAAVAVSWPYFFLLGARNMLLGVVMPGFLMYLIKDGRIGVKRIMTLTVFGLTVNYLMLAMLQFRKEGFQEFLRNPLGAVDTDKRHEGLNMIEELVLIDQFMARGQLDPNLGYDYLVHVLNVVPRAIWPGKPKLSQDYSMLRGQGNEDSGWLNATISTGIIGQGVMNFGRVAGPVAAGFILSFYARFLVAQYQRRSSFWRLAVFMVGVGLIPGLGREFTLLVLWPVVIGWGAVVWYEKQVKQLLVTDDKSGDKAHVGVSGARIH